MAHATMAPRTRPATQPTARATQPTARATQLEAQWVRVTDADGRARLEMRWHTGLPAAAVAAVPAARAA